MSLRKEAWKKKKERKKKTQDFNGVWTRDLAITGAMLYQLSYEATDVGSRSIVGSYVPVKEMSVIYTLYILRCTHWKACKNFLYAIDVSTNQRRKECS